MNVTRWTVTAYPFGQPTVRTMTTDQIVELIRAFDGLGSTGFDLHAARLEDAPTE